MQSCTFLGHSRCPDEIREKLLYTIESLILKNNVTVFYVGSQGAFDKLVYEVLCDLEKKYRIKIFVVLAYLNRTPKTPHYDIDKTIFPDELTKTPLRFAITRRNSFMINKSDYIVSFINTPFSKVYNNILETIKKKKHIINLGDFDIERIS